MNDKTRNILLIIAVVAIIVTIYSFQSTKVSTTNNQISNEEKENAMMQTTNNEETTTKPEYDSEGNLKAPELQGIQGYINTEEGLTLESLKGKVVLIDIWTYSCINCIRTLPYITSWDEKYRDKGLVIIGVHTPEFKFEKEYENVLEATKKYGIQYPVVLDNNYETWHAYNNRFWPRKYLINKEGYIVYDHIGEGGYTETETKIQELLQEELGANTDNIELTEETSSLSVGPKTPELYLGYNLALPRQQNLGNEGGFVIRTENDYTLPETMEQDIVYIEGLWKSNEDNLELIGEEGKILLKFRGKEANIVADSTETQDITITIGEETKTITINKPDLYNIYKDHRTAAQITITAQKGFSINSFTFG